MNDLQGTLKWLIPYAASVVLTKGVALITIPLLTRNLSTSDYGALELVSSVIEIAALILCFSAADLLFRFSGTNDAAEAKRNAAAIAGGAIALSIIVGGSLQFLVLLARPYMTTAIDVDLLTLGLLSASFSALIELPLAWLRSRGSASIFLSYVCARAFLQTSIMAITLTNGYGAIGVIAGNLLVDAVFSALLLWRQHRETGISFDSAILVRAARYGWPLLGGAIAMFILGNCDRWFLVGIVSNETLAHYALAAKLATIVALAMQPFGLWWNARRIRVLTEPGGDRLSADAIVWGFAFIAAGAVFVAMIIPPVVRISLPPDYFPALQWLPWLILIIAMNETSSLLNVSAYVGKTASPALVINTIGASAALIGYIFLVPTWGVAGAIAATIIGHALRIIAYIMHGYENARIPHRWVKIFSICILAFATIKVSYVIMSILLIFLLLAAFVATISLIACVHMYERKITAISHANGPV